MDLQLIFLPDHLDEYTIKGYHVGIQNTSQKDYIFTTKIQYKDKTLIEKRGELKVNDICQLDFMPFAALNNNTEFFFDFWQSSSDATGKKQSAHCKIKPKQFFQKKVFLDSIKREVILYDLEVIKTIQKSKSEDLSTYTKENIKPAAPVQQFVYSTDKIDLKSRIEFVNEIDLHLENLTDSPAKLSNSDKLHLQLDHAIDFIQQAIKHGSQKAYLIHGIGKGKLKERLHDLLHKHPQVKFYKNEYHHKYGYGATEVVFRN